MSEAFWELQLHACILSMHTEHYTAATMHIYADNL